MLSSDLHSQAIVVEQPGRIGMATLGIAAPGPSDLVVDIDFSGISTGTERLLFNGDMPYFPGMGYPLVPGYESVGRVSEAGADTGYYEGEPVFVPGADCFGEVRGLFGGSAQRVVVASARALSVDAALGEDAVLLALAATAFHALHPGPNYELQAPDLIVGHGVLGRLMARLSVALGAAPPTVWEKNAQRLDSHHEYYVCAPDDDDRRDYRRIVDVSGDAAVLDQLVGALGRGGEVVLAGFYSRALSFEFPPAFMREARFRVAAEWRRSDLEAVYGLAASGRLSLAGLITHRHDPRAASEVYAQTFADASRLKTILDWRWLQ